MPDKVRFCRKWNRTFNGGDVVELKIVDGADASPLPEEDRGRNWWTYGREVNGMVNTVDHKKGESHPLCPPKKRKEALTS